MLKVIRIRIGDYYDGKSYEDSSHARAQRKKTSKKIKTDVLEKINNLVGLTTVKQQLEQILGHVKVSKIKKNRGLINGPISLHTVFKGNPGTGKTTVARLMAEYFKEIGLLKKGHLVETNRSGLVAKYIGHTALQVKSVFTKALGGVLFIDEAYALAQGGEKDYGREAIDELIKLMEDHRENIVVIVAGYPKLMESFLETNPGLHSRFPFKLDFDDYSNEELFQIFQTLCSSEKYFFDKDFASAIKRHIISQAGMGQEKFGNGRGVRNIFESVKMMQHDRLAKLSNELPLSNMDLQTLLRSDIPTSKNPGTAENIKKSRIGFKTETA